MTWISGMSWVMSLRLPPATETASNAGAADTHSCRCECLGANLSLVLDYRGANTRY